MLYKKMLVGIVLILTAVVLLLGCMDFWMGGQDYALIRERIDNLSEERKMFSREFLEDRDVRVVRGLVGYVNGNLRIILIWGERGPLLLRLGGQSIYSYYRTCPTIYEAFRDGRPVTMNIREIYTKVEDWVGYVEKGDIIGMYAKEPIEGYYSSEGSEVVLYDSWWPVFPTDLKELCEK